MAFNSLTFLCFFAAVFALYWGVLSSHLRIRNAFLLIVSYVFYGYWDWRFLLLIVFSSAVDFLVGSKLEDLVSRTHRKLLLILSLCTNLGLLGAFKYYNFFVESAEVALAGLGITCGGLSLNIILPVGISFYTFQTLSYTIDVYRRKLNACHSIIDFFAYVSFFPQLVAGPIERASNLLPQFKKKFEFDGKVAVDATLQILWGVFKKVVVADNAAVFVDAIFSDYTNQSGLVLALGAVLFAVQIYGDFSGYSDIAIGVARMLGFNLMKNFACPYFSRDIAEFWRRWHISLSTWFRDYVYIPIGGSHGGWRSKVRNVLVVFVLSGVWHGANWTFVFWGLLNGLLFLPLIVGRVHRSHIDSVAHGRLIPTFKEVYMMATTFSITCICWVFFRAQTIQDAFSYLGQGIEGILENPVASFMALPLKPSELTFNFLTLIGSILLLFGIDWLQREKTHALFKLPFPMPIRIVLYLGLSVSVVEYFFGRGSFIYFQF